MGRALQTEILLIDKLPLSTDSHRQLSRALIDSFVEGFRDRFIDTRSRSDSSEMRVRRLFCLRVRKRTRRRVREDGVEVGRLVLSGDNPTVRVRFQLRPRAIEFWVSLE